MTGKTIRLHVETPIADRNELAGEPVGEYQRTTRVARFKVFPVGGGEYIQARQVDSSVTHILRCPYFVGANSLMRLANEDGTRIFKVDSVVNVNEDNRFLEWTAIEKT